MEKTFQHYHRFDGNCYCPVEKNKFVINHGVIYLLSAALCYAIADVVSFTILKNFEAVSFNVYLGIFTVIPLLLIRPKTLKKLSFYLKPKYAISIMVVTVEDTTATILIYFAYQMARNASQISQLWQHRQSFPSSLLP